MPKRTSKHPRRSSRPPSPKAKPPPEHWLLRWLKRIPGVILKTGGLAAAIGAIVGLALTILPSHSPKNIARFISVQTLSQIPLNQYQQRSATFAEQSAYYTHEQRRGLAAAVPGQTLAPFNGQDLPPTSPSAPATGTTPAAGTPSPTSPVSPTAVGSSAGTPSATATASPPSPVSPTATVSPSGAASPTRTAQPGGGIRVLLPPGLSSHSARQFAEQVLADIGEQGPACNMCRPFMAELKTNPDLPGVQKVLLPFAITASGQLVSPTVAASRIAGILSNTRTASGAGNNQGGQDNLREPLGELVSINMELEGLKGQPVFLSWEIFQTGSHTNLYGKWLSDFAAYRLQATTEDDTGSLDVWIPLPVAPGPYFIRLSLASDGARLASMDSSPFG